MDKMNDELMVNGVKYRRVEEPQADPPAPESPALKYTVGSVLLLPVRVVATEEGEYKVTPLFVDIDNERNDPWFTRIEVEGNGTEPSVGDRCYFFDRTPHSEIIGILKSIDYRSNYAYRSDSGSDWKYAVKFPGSEMSKERPELKPCWHCGSNDIVSGTEFNTTIRAWWHVKCSCCWCGYASAPTIAEAIVIWNAHPRPGYKGEK
jgi:hypothetical protein